MKYLVHYQYFKESGKHYSGHEEIVDGNDDLYPADQLYRLIEDVRNKLRSGNLPGLVPGAREFNVVVDVYDNPSKITLHDVAYSFMVPFQKSDPPAPPPAKQRPGERWRK